MATEHNVAERVWSRDVTLWPEPRQETARRLGWLDLPTSMPARLHEVEALVERTSSFERVVVMGMGGSSLGAEMLSRAAGTGRVQVLDSTHPAAVRRAVTEPTGTLFIAASKSGTTVETRAHLALVRSLGAHVIAVTDAGSTLAEDVPDHIVNPSDVGGRYSVLSMFGLVPGALAGLNVRALLEEAAEEAEACREGLPMAARLGAALAAFPTVEIRGILGPWVEQLVAESLGKDGRGVVPIVLADGDDAGPLGAALFRWQFATAIAGHHLGVNPFDQPDVEAAKAFSRRLLAGDAPEPDDGDLENALTSTVAATYVALCAFVDPTTDLEPLRARLAERTGLPVTLGYGPRFLHSTGQLHKGGPARMVAIQIVEDEPAEDLSIPEMRFSFGELLRAQADGDLVALRAAGRTAVRTTVGGLEDALRA